MKNFPHQFNDLRKLFNALNIIKELIDSQTPLTDDNFGEKLTRNQIYTYREKSLTINEFLRQEQLKPVANRGYLTVSRDIRRFFELMGFISVHVDKSAILSSKAKQLLQADSEETRKTIWKESMLQLGLEGTDGEISHPYRILLKIVNYFPGIETSKLMLALEAENDTEEEFDRISNLALKNIDEIIQDTSTTVSMSRNAVKILPSMAEQLGDIIRVDNKTFPIGQVIVTEDEITTQEPREIAGRTRSISTYRQTSSQEIARNPTLSIISSVSIDLADAIKIRQKRLVEHQKIVRHLAEINEQSAFNLFEGKFDCLAIKNNQALLYEVKTILPSFSDEEKQTVKGVGQLKYYKYSISQSTESYDTIKEVLVFSRKPSLGIISFCLSEGITVIWEEGNNFKVFDSDSNSENNFYPNSLLNI